MTDLTCVGIDVHIFVDQSDLELVAIFSALPPEF